MIKQNQTEREYVKLNGFNLRIGKFYDPNEFLNGTQMEIRITKSIENDNDTELFEALVNKIKDLLK